MSGDIEIYGAAFGQRLEADTSRDGYVDDGNIAWEERVVEARRQWPEARPEDFEKVGKRGWRDKATGLEFRQASGAPLLTVGSDANRGITCFFVEGGKLIFLCRADVPEGRYVHHGEIYAAQVIDGQIIRETR